jgi:predicted Zn-dependent protease
MRSAARLEVRVSRNGTTKTFKVPLTPACAFSAEIGNAPHVNAYTDGHRIMVTAGMLDTLSDAELTAILARELAHGTLGHARLMQMTSTLAGVIDALLPLRPDLAGFAGSAGIRPMDPALDQEADRVALYMLARASRDPALLPRTLARLAQYPPATVTSGYSAIHPWTAERAALMQTTVAELRQKQTSGQPLLP